MGQLSGDSHLKISAPVRVCASYRGDCVRSPSGERPQPRAGRRRRPPAHPGRSVSWDKPPLPEGCPWGCFSEKSRAVQGGRLYPVPQGSGGRKLTYCQFCPIPHFTLFRHISHLQSYILQKTFIRAFPQGNRPAKALFHRATARPLQSCSPFLTL